MASDIYAKFDGIDGESTDAGHDKWLDVISFNHGLSQQMSAMGQGSGRTGGRSDFAPVTLVSAVDKSTVKLNQHCANGKHIDKVEINFCLATEEQHVYLKYELEHVVISNINIDGGSGGDKPMVSMSLSFSKIKWEYTPIDHNGKKGASEKANWNLEKNISE